MDFELSDEWLELGDIGPVTVTKELWEALGRGDDVDVRAYLEEQGFYFASDEDGEDDYIGPIEFKGFLQPDDIVGEVLRIWVRAVGEDDLFVGR